MANRLFDEENAGVVRLAYLSGQSGDGGTCGEAFQTTSVMKSFHFSSPQRGFKVVSIPLNNYIYTFIYTEGGFH